MKRKKDVWVIVDTRTLKTLHGISNNTMIFSSKEVATEIATQLFSDASKFLTINILLP